MVIHSSFSIYTTHVHADVHAHNSYAGIHMHTYTPFLFLLVSLERIVCTGIDCELDGEKLHHSEWRFEQCYIDEHHEASVAIHLLEDDEHERGVEGIGEQFIEMDVSSLLQRIKPLMDIRLDSEEAQVYQSLFGKMKDRKERHGIS
eukprot:m.64955 g.64955  ORF g.64955 m.64955 type:complete len:146 (+) comp11506_c0_seq3:36-473(+)